MPTLSVIEQINQRLIKYGNEVEVLQETGEKIRKIAPPKQELDDDLSQLLSDTPTASAPDLDSILNQPQDNQNTTDDTDLPSLTLEEQESLRQQEAAAAAQKALDEAAKLTKSHKDKQKAQQEAQKKVDEGSLSNELPQDFSNNEFDSFSDFSDFDNSTDISSVNELEDIESFLAGDKDSLDINSSNEFKDFDSSFDFEDSANGDFDLLANSQSPQTQSEPEDDVFSDLMSEANRNAVEKEFGNADELFALDELSEEPQDEEVATQAEDIPDAHETEKEESDSLFGEYLTDASEFELSDSITSGSQKSKEPIQNFFSLSGVTQQKKEFYLSEDQVYEVKHNLTYLPRNLKIAVEEFIAKESTKEETVQTLTDMLLANASAKKIADLLEKETGESIKLPARYRSMSGYDMVARQNSFIYKFLTIYLPNIIITTCIIAGITFLLWIGLGIVTPWTSALTKYKEGRNYILKGYYEKAEECFTLAYFGNEKNRWPYKGFPHRKETLKYAALYEKVRQYNYSEKKYQLLLQNHWEKPAHLKETKLKYAKMLSENLMRYDEACTQLHEIKEGGIVPGTTISFKGIGNDADSDFALARVYFLRGDEENRMDYYDEAMSQISAYLATPSKKDTYKVITYDLWYLSKIGEKEKISSILKTQFLAPKKINKFKRAKKDLRIFNDIVSFYLDHRHPNEPLPQLMKLLESDFPEDPELNWHRSRQHRLSTRYDLERKSLNRTLNILQVTPFHTPRELRIDILATARIGELNYEENFIFEAKNRLVNAIQNYEALLERGILQPDSEYGKMYANLGNLFYYNAGNLDAAFLAFVQAEDNKYKSHEMDYKQGFINYWRGDYKKAKQEFYYVLEQVPDNNNAIFAMANAMLEDFNLSHAQSHFVRYIHNLSQTIPGFGSNIDPQRKDQAAILSNLEAAHNNLGITLYRQFERTSDVEKRDKAMLAFTRSLEYFNLLGRKDTIRSGATQEAIRSYSIPSLTSTAALNQHEIWYNEPTPNLVVMKPIPFDLKTIDLANIMEFQSVLMTHQFEEILEPLESSVKKMESVIQEAAQSAQN